MSKQYEYDEATKTLALDTPLTNRAEVLLICKEIDADTPVDEIELFITGAHVLVCDTLDGYGVLPARLLLVERYLAAHFAAITYLSASFESVGKVQASYFGKVGLNLDQTRYGQQAKIFDPTGQLKKIDDGVIKRYSIDWLGTKRCEGTPCN